VLRIIQIILFFYCFQLSAQKIEGVSIVSQKLKSNYDVCNELNELGANWFAICPFGIMKTRSTDFVYNSALNYYGDKGEGLIEQIRNAKKVGLKICIKPHLYMRGEGWLGEYDPGKSKWPVWEGNYRAYLLFLAELGQREKVDLILLGTECKTSVNQRPQFWNNLIDSVRAVYSGELSYAANWDNYQTVPFWEKLDFISIDAYFPLSKKKTPTVDEIEKAWMPINQKLADFSASKNKKIIFTEYGYRSTDNAAGQQWLIESRSKMELVNLEAQEHAYQGFYNSVWGQDWFAGGFIWKWYQVSNAGGLLDADYTPQNKPVISIIRKIYEE
jgi:hypothetical protein